MKNLLIVGCGGFGREVSWLVSRINKKTQIWNLKGYIDDNKDLHGTLLNGVPVLGDLDTLVDIYSESYAVIAIGNPEARRSIVEKLKERNFTNFATLIDPSVLYSDLVSIGVGSILCAGVILTVNIRVGDHVIINLDSTVGHDCIIENFSTIYPGAHISGNVRLGTGVQIGTGSSIIQGVTVEEEIFVGAQAAVVNDLNQPGIYIGVPAKKKD